MRLLETQGVLRPTDGAQPQDAGAYFRLVPRGALQERRGLDVETSIVRAAETVFGANRVSGIDGDLAIGLVARGLFNDLSLPISVARQPRSALRIRLDEPAHLLLDAGFFATTTLDRRRRGDSQRISRVGSAIIVDTAAVVGCVLVLTLSAVPATYRLGWLVAASIACASFLSLFQYAAMKESRSLRLVGTQRTHRPKVGQRFPKSPQGSPATTATCHTGSGGNLRYISHLHRASLHRRQQSITPQHSLFQGLGCVCSLVRRDPARRGLS